MPAALCALAIDDGLRGCRLRRSQVLGAKAMSRPTHLHPADVHGIARLAVDATAAVTDIVEAMHAGVLRPSPTNPERSGRAGALAGFAYSSVRTVAHLIAGGLDVAARPLVPLFGEQISTAQRDALLSILSGVIGDHLMQTGNPLAVRMELRRGGQALVPARGSRSPPAGSRLMATALPHATSRIAVLIHGLCGTDAQWKRSQVEYAATLEGEHGFTPVYLRYNSGLHVSTNGRLLAELLDQTLREWPVAVEELLLVGHSMGGLVARSAVHHGRQSARPWTRLVRRMAFLGTPHHGAPLERGGNWFEEVLGSVPYAAPLSRLGRLRSAGITDLRHGNLLDEDWQGSDRFARGQDRRRPLSLPDGVDCIAVAATTGAERGDARDRLVGDGLVPLDSALGHHTDPERELALAASQRLVVYRTHHMGLLGHAEVREHLSRWLVS